MCGARARSPHELDLRSLGMVLEKNGEIVGRGAAVLGHPAMAMAMLADVLAGLGLSLPAGSVVLSGGITEAVEVEAGDSVVARFQELGTVSQRMV